MISAILAAANPPGCENMTCATAPINESKRVMIQNMGAFFSCFEI